TRQDGSARCTGGRALRARRSTRAAVVYADDDTAVLDLLCAEREALLVEAGRLRNQLHALLMQVDPEYRRRLPKLDSVAGIKATTNYPLPKADGLQRRRAESVRRLATRLSLTLFHIDDLTTQIEALAAIRFTPLTQLCGISLLTAGTLAGILGPGAVSALTRSSQPMPVLRRWRRRPPAARAAD